MWRFINCTFKINQMKVLKFIFSILSLILQFHSQDFKVWMEWMVSFLVQISCNFEIQIIQRRIFEGKCFHGFKLMTSLFFITLMGDMKNGTRKSWKKKQKYYWKSEKQFEYVDNFLFIPEIVMLCIIIWNIYQAFNKVYQYSSHSRVHCGNTSTIAYWKKTFRVRSECSSVK